MNPITLRPIQLNIEFKGSTYRGIAIPHLSLNLNNVPSEFSIRFYHGICANLAHTSEGWTSNELKPARLATIIGTKINSYYELMLE
jgi:hypothetical protein